MRTQEQYDSALANALHNQALTNYPTIFAEFMQRGIPESEIKPRENVFTFNAWRALGRTVRKGEHGVKVLTFITTESKKDLDKDGNPRVSRRPWTTTVFHISQTDAWKQGGAQ